MSAMTNLAALFPPEGISIWNPSLPWQPIPVHTVSLSEDRVSILHNPEGGSQAARDLQIQYAGYTGHEKTQTTKARSWVLIWIHFAWLSFQLLLISLLPSTHVWLHTHTHTFPSVLPSIPMILVPNIGFSSPLNIQRSPCPPNTPLSLKIYILGQTK